MTYNEIKKSNDRRRDASVCKYKIRYETELLIEYATRELGYDVELIEMDNGQEEHLFTKTAL